MMTLTAEEKQNRLQLARSERGKLIRLAKRLSRHSQEPYTATCWKIQAFRETLLARGVPFSSAPASAEEELAYLAQRLSDGFPEEYARELLKESAWHHPSRRKDFQSN